VSEHPVVRRPPRDPARIAAALAKHDAAAARRYAEGGAEREIVQQERGGWVRAGNAGG